MLFTFASMITYNTWVLLGLMAVSFAAFKLSHIKLREVLVYADLYAGIPAS